jgi:hypothetical protein
MRFVSPLVLVIISVAVGGGGCGATTTSNGRSHPNHSIKSGNCQTSFRPRTLYGTNDVTSIILRRNHRGGAVVMTKQSVPQRSSKATSMTGTTTAGVVTTNGLPKALAGVMTFAMIEKLVKMTLQQLKIVYPAQLGACIVLFVLLCITDTLISSSFASNMYSFLTPGAALLAKWFPIFFIPGLVLLPLSPPIGGTTDVSHITNENRSTILSHLMRLIYHLDFHFSFFWFRL